MASEIRNDCVGCTALGLPCRHCYMGRDYRVLICDKCGTEVDMLYIIDNDSEELCGECAKEKAIEYLSNHNVDIDDLCEYNDIPCEKMNGEDYYDKYCYCDDEE